MAAGAPKAFVNLAGRPMLEYALEGLRNSGVVDRVVVAVPPSRTDEAKLVFGRDAVIVAGGSDRTESVRLALAAVGDAEFVLVHDAARALTPTAAHAKSWHAVDGRDDVVEIVGCIGNAGRIATPAQCRADPAPYTTGVSHPTTDLLRVGVTYTTNELTLILPPLPRLASAIACAALTIRFNKTWFSRPGKQ